MANYAHVENGTITGVYDLIPDNWRNISNFFLLKDDAETFYNLGWRTIVKADVSYNPDYQRLDSPTYTIENDTVIETMTVVDIPQQPVVEYTEEEILARKTLGHNLAMTKLRELRDELLYATDFTQLADVIKLNGDELTHQYEVYRQELRDLPNLYDSNIDFDNAFEVIFPTKPGSA